MNNLISIWGIETNNLKNIDIQLACNGINLIVGPSGSGKSSLAYDTIAQIGQHEFMSMFADDVSEPTYRIKGHKKRAFPSRKDSIPISLVYFTCKRRLKSAYLVAYPL